MMPLVITTKQKKKKNSATIPTLLNAHEAALHPEARMEL
jgi:hypothetical protein